MNAWVESWLSGVGRRLLRLAGHDVRTENPDITEFEWRTWRVVQPFTLMPLERVLAMLRATEYLVKANVRGAVVECGVWRGGGAMAMAATLAHLGDTSREMFLYDTFEGMSAPSDRDVDYGGGAAAAMMRAQGRRALARDVWAYAPIEDARGNLQKTGYPLEKVCLVRGRVEETIPAQVPERIALLHLDTDWYESTLHELKHLYPRLARGGVLILDDYGHWLGAKQAVDEYFAGTPLLLQRVDTTCRVVVKLD